LAFFVVGYSMAKLGYRIFDVMIGRLATTL
jgi:hypothetical protein